MRSLTGTKAWHDERDHAARMIQARFRAYRQQKQFLRLKDAANTISTFAKGWFVRKKVAQERGRLAEDERFAGVMDRHKEHMQALEQEKRLIERTAAVDLDDLWVKRNRSAAVVQAHWRGWVQRKRHGSSPERLGRQKAALQIQAAFKKHMSSRQSSGDPHSSSPSRTHHQQPGSHSTISTHRHSSPTHDGHHIRAQGTSNFTSHASSPTSFRGFDVVPTQTNAAASFSGSITASQNNMQLRGSHASVLMGSPPAKSLGVGLQLDMDPVQPVARVMSNKRYADLEKQINSHVDAYKSLSRTRHKDARSLDEALAPLLYAHTTNAQARLHATAPRQRALLLSDALFGTLEHISPLSQLPPGAAPSDYPRPAHGSARMVSAAGAHALMLAEARVGTRWWAPLKALNKASLQEARLQEEEERWDAMEGVWRRRWGAITAAEERRPDPLSEFEKGVGLGSRAVAAAAVEKRREVHVQAMVGQF